MSNTIDDFRNFYRTDKEKKEFEVKETIQSLVDMQSAQMKNNNINLDISGDEFMHNGLQSEFQQVILNLINNAKDALVENNIKDPVITIKLNLPPMKLLNYTVLSILLIGIYSCSTKHEDIKVPMSQWKFHPGDNVGCGKDHTLYAKSAGKVEFKVKGRHNRTFINVVN